MRRRNVLIFPAGTEIGLEIARALWHCKEVRLHAAGQDVSNHARFIHADYHVIPGVKEAGWEMALKELCNSLSIDYIFPCHDDVIVALSRIRNEIPAVLVTSPQETCEITRSKSATYRTFRGIVPVPVIHETVNSVRDFPVIVKPDRGQGSFGVVKARSSEELQRAWSELEQAVICEYLPGKEYTVDCFSDRAAGVLFAKARDRSRVRSGISVSTSTADEILVLPLAEAIHAHLPLHGAWFFQVKESKDGILTLLEIAPRIAGSMAAHRVRGVNFPLLSIFEQERKKISILENPGRIEMDRALSNRYRHDLTFSALYIDLDDTLLVHGQVNLLAIKLIFRCLNEGKAVHLLTRHEGEVSGILARYRIVSLFDSVVHVRDGGPKSSYILSRDAIFVDDSFSERAEVSAKLGIPTYDCSMIECLTEIPDGSLPTATEAGR